MILINTQIKVFKEKATSSLNRRIKYFLHDIVGQVFLISVILESMFFMKILNTPGAAKFKLNLKPSIDDLLILQKIYLYILFTVILMSFTYLLSERIRVAILIIIKMLYSVLLLGDIWYYRGFKDFLSLHNLGESQNMQNLHGTAFAMGRRIDLVFVGFNILILGAAIIARKRYRPKTKEKGMFALLFITPFLIVLTIHFAEDFRGSKYHGDVLFQTQFIPFATMRNLTPIGYHFYDTVVYLKDNMSYNLSEGDKKDITEWLNYKNENLPPNEYTGMFKGKNLIFIQVESLENFMINQSYQGQVLTPNLNNMLKNSYYFSNFYEQVNNGNSADADLMVNASVLPVRRGSTFFRFPNNEYNTLPKLLQEESYYTRSLHSADGNIWNITRAFENFDFNESWDIRDFRKIPETDAFNMGISDKSFFKDVSGIIPKDKTPFYYYAVTVSSHVPFTIPEDLKTLKFSRSFDNSSMGNYLQAINYADRQIGSFIKGLDEQGVLDNSVVVVMGDHCGIHKYYPDRVNSMKDKEDWWENNTKVPFIVYSKSIQGKEIKTIGAQIDVLPTVAALMGVDENKYKNTTMGRNLFNTNKNYAILNDGTIESDKKLSNADIKHIKKSFDISDLITKSEYFKTQKLGR